MVTNQQLFDEGSYIEQWDYENGDIAVLVEWEGQLYIIHTARDNSAVRFPDKSVMPKPTKDTTMKKLYTPSDRKRYLKIMNRFEGSPNCEEDYTVKNYQEWYNLMKSHETILSTQNGKAVKLNEDDYNFLRELIERTQR